MPSVGHALKSDNGNSLLENAKMEEHRNARKEEMKKRKLALQQNKMPSIGSVLLPINADSLLNDPEMRKFQISLTKAIERAAGLDGQQIKTPFILSELDNTAMKKYRNALIEKMKKVELALQQRSSIGSTLSSVNTYGLPDYANLEEYRNVLIEEVKKVELALQQNKMPFIGITFSPQEGEIVAYESKLIQLYGHNVGALELKGLFTVFYPVIEESEQKNVKSKL